MKLIAFLLAAFAAFGCTRRTYVTDYGDREAPKEADAKIEVYNLTRPTRPFRELGEIEVRSNTAKSMKKILMMARKMGADAVILTGAAGSQAQAYAVTDNYAVGERHEYGKKAIAIVYTDKGRTPPEPTATNAAPGGMLGRPASPAGAPLE